MVVWESGITATNLDQTRLTDGMRNEGEQKKIIV